MSIEDISSQNKEQAPTGWESVAELANGEHAVFENTCNVAKKRMRLLNDEHVGSSFSRTFSGFVDICHEKTPEFINTAANRAAQLAEEDDPEISVLLHSTRAGISGGRWGTRGEMGTGEYIFDALGSKCTPANIGRLETIMKTIPSSDYARYENMRMDAYRIENLVIDGRSFIHDSAPEAHRLIDAMVDYYDAKDIPEQAEEKRAALSELFSELRSKHGAGYNGSHDKYMLDLANYDKPANTFIGDPVGLHRDKQSEADQVYDGDKGEVKAIDILRRLQKNMEPVAPNAPYTKIPELNDAFERLGQIKVNEKTGELQVSIDDLSDVLNAVNHHLIENQGQRDLYPSTISAVAYIDKLCTAAIKNLSKKEWQEIAFDPTFKEALRFAQVTMSGEYSEDKFEQMYSNFARKAGEAFGDDGVDDARVSEAFGIVQSQVLKNAAIVAKEFSGNPNLDYLAAAVWSGNLTHELIGLPEKY